MKRLNLIGQEFGLLTAIENIHLPDGRLGWRCECSCGNTVDVHTSPLSAGKVVDCGCILKTKRDCTGDVHGELTITGLHTEEKGRKIWSYQCSCGNTGEKLMKNIQRCPHCGCKSSSGEINGNEINVMVNGILSTYKGNARTKGYDFELTKKEFSGLIQSDCYYCGVKPQRRKELRGVVLLWNGVDRMENNTGYINGNVVSCCSDCNYLKNKRSNKEFLEKVFKIYHNLKEESSEGNC